METYSDERILTQPLGYWTSMAGRSSVTYIRATLSRHDLTQPQWWILNYVAANPRSHTDSVIEYHRGFIDTDDELRPAVESLVGDGLLESTDDVLSITPSGQTRREATWPSVNTALATLRTGISDSEFITTIRTLQRVIDNAGAAAWHA